MVGIIPNTKPATQCTITVGPLHDNKRTSQDKESVTKKAKVEERQTRVDQSIKTHNFAKQVEIILPSSSYNKDLERLLVGPEPIPFFRVRCSLKLFLQGDFMDLFIKKNSCLVISETKIDHEDTFAISNGTLHISLTKESFERAGLTSNFKKPKSRDINTKYRTSFDLRSPKSIKGQSNLFDRLLWAADNTLNKDVDFAFTLTDSTGNPIGSASKDMDKVLEGFKEFNLHKSYVNCTTTVYEDITAAIPRFALPKDYQPETPIADKSLFDPHKFDLEVLQEWGSNLHEWLGLVSLGSDRLQVGDSVDKYISSYEPGFANNDKKNEAKSITIVKWRGGLIPAHFIWNLWKLVEATSSWVSLNVYGVEDSPVSWGNREHTVTVNGENNYQAVKLAEDDHYLLLEILDGGDP